MVPQQMIGPRPRLACRIHILATEEICLHVHLLDRELTRLNPAVDPLVTGIETPNVPLVSNASAVALREGAWIETSLSVFFWSCLSSRSARARGLKHHPAAH